MKCNCAKCRARMEPVRTDPEGDAMAVFLIWLLGIPFIAGFIGFLIVVTP